MKKPKNITVSDLDHQREIQKNDDKDDYCIRKYVKFSLVGVFILLLIICILIIIMYVVFAIFNPQKFIEMAGFREMAESMFKMLLTFILGALSKSVLKNYLKDN